MLKNLLQQMLQGFQYVLAIVWTLGAIGLRLQS